MIAVVRAIITIVAILVQMYRDGEAQDAVLAKLNDRLTDRLNAAKAAERGELPDETTDPNNRSRFGGMSDGDPPLSVG